MHLCEEQLHIVEFLSQIIHAVTQSKYFGVFLNQLIASLRRPFNHDLVFVFTL